MIARLSRSLPLLGGLGLLACGVLGGYNLHLVRELESGLAELRLAQARSRSRPAAEPATPARPTAEAELRDELDALRARVADLMRGASQQVAVPEQLPVPAELPVPENVPVPEKVQPPTSAAPSGGEVTAPPISERMNLILGSLESQDQALLKEAVAAVLEQREAEEREARRQREIEAKVRELTRRLSLTAVQSARVAAVIEEERRSLDEMRAETADATDRRRKAQEIQHWEREQVSRLLTAEQFAKYTQRDGGGRARQPARK